MADREKAAAESSEEIQIDLRDPMIAGFWAWFWPGAGHLYQRRYAKGVLFMVCILGTYFFGLTIGGGKVVYASFSKEHHRLPYYCQVGVGLPALPALVQTYRVRNGQKALAGGIMAPPNWFDEDNPDPLAEWHKRYHYFFELGTVYTMIAGLLNVLAIYDACCGPVMAIRPDEEKDEEDKEKTDGRPPGEEPSAAEDSSATTGA